VVLPGEDSVVHGHFLVIGMSEADRTDVIFHVGLNLLIRMPGEGTVIPASLMGPAPWPGQSRVISSDSTARNRLAPANKRQWSSILVLQFGVS
jgi:hypothetical protein